jgi:hypothetical protein
MRRSLIFFLSICILNSALGMVPAFKKCRMSSPEKSCPCKPKKAKKSCSFPAKPQKHLAQKSQKVILPFSERFFLPLSPIISPFLYFRADHQDSEFFRLLPDKKPPDKLISIYLLQQNFRC